MSIQHDNALVKYEVPLSTPPDQDVKTSLTRYEGEVTFYPSFICLEDKSHWIPWDKVYSANVTEDE